MRYLRRHWRLLIVLLIYVVIATAHSLIVPLTTGNDEWAHFLYIRFIAEHGRLPINRTERNWEEAGYKSDDPPFYHLITSAAIAGIEEPTRLVRPIDSPQRQLADSVVYPYEFMLHTGPELFPYRGEVLLWHLARGVSIFWGVIVIGLTYFISLELFASCRRALVSAALLAFLPSFVFHSSVVSYESLSAVITSLFLLVGIKAIKQPQRWLWWLTLGILAGLAITTKYSAVLLPVEIVFIAWLATRISREQIKISAEDAEAPPDVRPSFIRRHWLQWRTWFARLLLAGLGTILAVSWWFGFIVWYFNTVETQGWIVGILEPILVRGAADSTAVSITAIFFGEENVTADVSTFYMARNYPRLARITMDSFWSGHINGRFFMSPWLSLLFTLVALLGLAGLGRVWRQGGKTTRVWLILLLLHTLLIVPLLVVRLLFAFNPLEVTQGRHILIPAASAIAILLVWGLEQWHRKLSHVFVAGLLLWSVLGQLGWAATTYLLPIPVWTEHAPETEMASIRPVDITLVDSMKLTGFSWQEIPEETFLRVTLWWQALAEIPADYLVEIALLDQDGNIVSYNLSHPVQGRYPTRAWEPDDLVKDVHWLPLVGPLAGEFQIRLRLLDREAQPSSTASPVWLGQVALAVPASQFNPCAVWFQGQLNRGGLLSRPYLLDSTFTIVGPDRPRLKPMPGQPDQAEQTPLVSVDDFHIFMVGPDWSEEYQLVVGSAPCHHLVFDVPSRNFTPPEIPNLLEANFNNEVKLLGYELSTRHIQPGGRLPLTLYWQALDYMGEDYQIFDNLLDSEQHRWGGYDRRARDGYSTMRWVPDEVITDAFGVPVDLAAPPGVYTLDIGLYRQTADRAESLALVVEGQPTAQTSIRLGPIKVGGPPPDVIVTNPMPQTTLRQSLGGQITLLGYDLTDAAGQPLSTPSSPDSVLNLTLYWQVDASPSIDYSTFVHLRDISGQTVTQQDAPPANGRYPTSLWEPGEVIVDEISLPLADLPPGPYTLVVGLYDLATSQRLAVPGNPANEISLESIDLP